MRADDTCVQPHYFHYIASFISEHTSLPTPPPRPTVSTSPPPAPASPLDTPAAAVPTADERVEPEPSSPAVSTTSSSGSSFELVDRSVSSLTALDKGDGVVGEKEQRAAGDALGRSSARGGISAGSMGPRQELEEAMREGEELVKEKL